MAEQAGRLTHTSNLFHTEPQARLARRLVEASFADRVFYANSGTEANEAAIKFARKFAKVRMHACLHACLAACRPRNPSANESPRSAQHPALSLSGARPACSLPHPPTRCAAPRPPSQVRAGVDPYDAAASASAPSEIVSFTNSFHGRTMGALALTYKDQYKTPFQPVMPGAVMAPYRDVAAAAAAIRRGRTAAVFVEPLQGEGGIHAAGAEFLGALRELCDEAGALLVFDEVQVSGAAARRGAALNGAGRRGGCRQVSAAACFCCFVCALLCPLGGGFGRAGNCAWGRQRARARGLCGQRRGGSPVTRPRRRAAGGPGPHRHAVGARALRRHPRHDDPSQAPGG